MTIKYLKEHILELPELVRKNAIAIYVYGSVARQDAEADSDCDILVCINDCSEQEYNKLKKSVEPWEKRFDCEFSFYQMMLLREMQIRGSYFLWHIKIEGVLIYQQSSAFENLLNGLSRYTGTAEDFLEYNEILNDIEDSISQDESTIVYDLSVLATIARNICIGCCYILGDMVFGRKTPVIKCMQVWKDEFPFTLSEYIELYEFRLLSTRNKKIDYSIASANYIYHWLNKIRTLLDLAFSLVR